MSIKLMGQVWECRFTKAEQSVMLAMADHAKDDGTDCYPSIERIAWKTDYSSRQVQRVIKDLSERRILILVRRGGRGRAAEYRIDLNKADPKPDFTPKKHDTMSPYTPKHDMVSPQIGPEKDDTMSSNGLKGDIVSSNTDTKRVTFDTEKGDILSLKDDIAMSPQSLTNEPSGGDGISSSDSGDSEIGAKWETCLSELERTLPRGFLPTLIGSRIERDGDVSGIPRYRVLIAKERAQAGLNHFTHQAGPAIRRKWGGILGRQVLIEIVADEPISELEAAP